jgi:putative membrane protein
MHTLWNIFLLSITVFAVSKILPGIRIKSFITAIIVAVVYSVINYLIGWLLVMLSLPAMILTFGLFTFVINAFLLWVTDKLIQDFEIKNLTTTLIAAILITLISTLLKWLL